MGVHRLDTGEARVMEGPASLSMTQTQRCRVLDDERELELGGKTSPPPRRRTPPPSPRQPQRQQQQQQQKQPHYALEMAGDLASAAAASFAVSPFIAIVDKSIVSNASGRQALWPALVTGAKDACLRPHKFLRRPEFWWIAGLYTATYMAANSVDTFCRRRKVEPTLPKFLATTGVNMPFCIAKDRAFARLFGVIAAKPLPLPSYGLFAVRDSMTIAASFSAPQHVSGWLQQKGVKQQHSDVIAQLLCPAIVQVVSTPLHLLGLDLYNNGQSSAAARSVFIQREYTKSVLARVARIGPAFGIGGVVNKRLRDMTRSSIGAAPPLR
eukprot:jgi/Chlat1/1172/Chrsp113S01638